MANNNENKVLNVPHLRFPEFSGEWEMVSLQDIATINPKSDPLQNTFIYIDLEAVEKGELRKIQEIMREEAPSRAQRVIDNNDILFQCVRPYQKNNYIHRILNTSNQQWVASTGYAQIRTTELPNYIYHLLNTDEFNRKVMVRCTGSSYPAINSEDLATIHLYYTPDKKEQLKISRLLDLLDKRIATQNKIIEKYESLINGINCKIFASIQGSEYRLGDIATITNGNSNVQDASTEYRIGFYPFFDRSEEIKYLPTFLFDKESIIYPGEGTEFTPRYFNGKFAVHQRCYAIFDFKEVVNPKFVYFFLKTQNSYFIRNAVGSTVPSLRLDTFQKLKVVIPLPEIQHSVSSFLSVLEQKLDVENNVIKKFLWQKQYLLRQMFI